MTDQKDIKSAEKSSIFKHQWRRSHFIIAGILLIFFTFLIIFSFSLGRTVYSQSSYYIQPSLFQNLIVIEGKSISIKNLNPFKKSPDHASHSALNQQNNDKKTTYSPQNFKNTVQKPFKSESTRSYTSTTYTIKKTK